MNDFEKTIRKIELLEKEWRYELSDVEDKEHSFGRVAEDGKTVAFWSVPRNTGEFLQFMVELIGAKKVLELGCSVGFSTLFLAEAVKKTSGVVFTTEILKEKVELAKQHFKEAKSEDKIVLFEEDIDKVLEGWDLDNKVDFVFIDADKQRYKDYLERIFLILDDNGLIVVDNAGKVAMPDGSFVKCEYIQDFVSFVRNDERFDSKYLDIDNGLLLIKKNVSF